MTIINIDISITYIIFGIARTDGWTKCNIRVIYLFIET